MSYSESKSADVVDRIVAVVNNDIILLNDLKGYTKHLISQIKQSGYSPEEELSMIKKIKQKTLNKMIDAKLADQEIKRHRITVSDQEVELTIEQSLKSKHSDIETLKQALVTQDLTWEEYRERFKEQLLRRKLLRKEVNSKFVITSEDIKEYYETHKEKFAGEKKYHLRNIVMKVSSDDDERKAVLKRMNEILIELKEGKTFQTLASLYSDSKTAMDGGDLGFIDYQDLSKQLKEALKYKKAGECSAILESESAFKLFYIEEIKQSKGKTLEEATEDIDNELYTEFVNNEYKKWLGNLRKRSHIKIYEVF